MNSAVRSRMESDRKLVHVGHVVFGQHLPQFGQVKCVRHTYDPAKLKFPAGCLISICGAPARHGAEFNNARPAKSPHVSLRRQLTTRPGR